VKLVGYLRVSTDDKGQDPDRQKAIILAAASRQGHEIVAWAVDEGISGTVPPLQRQGVLEALDLCQEHKAKGIMVESVDRWTRGGWTDLGVSMFQMETDYDDAQLIVADLPTEDKFLWELLAGIMASVAKMFNVRLRAQIKSGLANAKAKGWPNGEPGRKPKPPMTPGEAEVALRVLETEGKNGVAANGYHSAALAVSKARGAFTLSDPKRRQHATVSSWWVRNQLRERVKEMPHLASRVAAINQARRSQIEVESSGGSQA